MDRRAFIGTLAGGLLAAPLAAEGQLNLRQDIVCPPCIFSAKASRLEA